MLIVSECRLCFNSIKNRGMKRAKFTRDETASPQGQPHPHQPSLPAAASSSSASAMANEKQIKDKFRSNISGVIVMTLSSYRRDNCPVGHITNDDDFRYLAKKVSTAITTTHIDKLNHV